VLSPHCKQMYSRLLCAAAQHRWQVPSQLMQTEDV
jgi:hypothetical protein